MDIAALSAELTADTLTRGYAGMSDVEAAADLNTEYRSQDKSSLTSSEVFNAIVIADYNALDAADQEKIKTVLSLGIVNPFGKEATVFTNVFGGGSDTITALAAIRIKAISRATELDLGTVRAGDVQMARM